MQDAKTFGSEIAALAMGKLKHIALSPEDDATKAIKVKAVNTSVGQSLALGRGAAIAEGMSAQAADQWRDEAIAAVNAAMLDGRQAIAAREAPPMDERH
ncbi:hypothetical protein HA461_20390 [Rhizobium leguminosarum bv. trifolii]|uniref:hypothetical protein n=1 Tax=Rhizobium leguminosarum TaxID=384 RepID=UPI00140F8570|nr:hypothetical protein [Rhizobium leguminosarum]QIO53385.1 hypothetical protein HA461_20390 [Rhizobium leguminosarum bv. trifolii]